MQKYSLISYFTETAAVDLTKIEKSFSSYLTHFMPIIDKMEPEEIVDIFQSAKKVIDLEKELLKITDPAKLVARVQELQKKNPPEYPDNKNFINWMKSLKDLKGIQNEIKDDIGLDVSDKYINKVLYELDKMKEDKPKMLKYFTNIVLKGAGHGIVSSLDSEKLIGTILASQKIELGSGVVCKLEETKDGQGFKIYISGTFRSGNSYEKTVNDLKKFWKTFDID
jgi:hypothetical protein